MVNKVMPFLLNLLVIWVIASCSKVPEIPTLPGPTPQPIDRIFISDKIGPKEIRQIFSSINRDGKLNSLKPYIENSTDAEIERFSTLFSKYFYEESFFENSLVTLIENRTQKKGFSDWNSKVTSFSQSPYFKDTASYLHTFFNHPAALNFIRADLPLFNPDFNWVSYRFSEPSAINENTSKISSDIKIIIEQPQNQTSLQKLVKETERTQSGQSIMDTLNVVSQTKETELFKTSALRIKDLLQETNDEQNQTKLQSFFNFLTFLDHPSNGFFKTASEFVHTHPDFVRKAAEMMEPTLFQNAAETVIETLIDSKDPVFDREFWKNLPRKKSNDAPTSGFSALFSIILYGTEKSLMIEIGAKDPSLYLNTWALTRWIEELVRSQMEYITKPEVIFPIGLWALNLPTQAIQFELFEGNTKKLAHFIQADFKELKLQGMVEGLEALLTKKEFYKFSHFSYEPDTKSQNLKNSFKSAFSQFQRTRKIITIGSFFTTFIHQLTSTQPSENLTLLDLETENYLTSIEGMFRGSTHRSLKKMFKLLFVDFKIANLDSDTRDLITEPFLQTPNHLDFVNGFLNQVQYFYDFTLPTKGYSSGLFDLYHRFLTLSRPDNKVVNSLSLFIQQTQLFAVDSKRNPIFQGITQALFDTNDIEKTLNRYSKMNRKEARIFLNTLSESLGEFSPNETGFENNFSILQDLIQKHDKAYNFLSEKFLSSGWQALPTIETITNEERHFLNRFVRSSDFDYLVDSIKLKLTREDLIKIVQELKSLSQKGHLNDALELIGRIQNDRIKRFSKVLRIWAKSGEFDTFLTSLETIFKG